MQKIEERLLKNPVRVLLIGVGGTGSHVLTGLARLHLTMLGLGHPYGLFVEAVDPDVVEAHNVGRQLFYPGDVGQGKADVIMNRVNLSYGLGWRSMTGKIKGKVNTDILISCVDSKKSRRSILKCIKNNDACYGTKYLIDCGNGPDSGQVLLGEYGSNAKIPLPYVSYPELIHGKDDNVPTCSLVESIESQSLFINQIIATYCMKMLWDMFRHGIIRNVGYFINFLDGKVSVKENYQGVVYESRV